MSLTILLIVPYGIETIVPTPAALVARLLLIVPYGIETEFRNRRFYTNGLLIVPYGIETQEPSRQYP